MRFSSARVLVLGSLLFLSGCNWLGLPDVKVLKTQFPVVHYDPTIKAKALTSGPSGVKAGGRIPGKATGKKHDGAMRGVSDHHVTFEKGRPATWLTLNEISKVAVGAIVVSEDWAFYQHKGYDPNQIREALNKDLATGKFARGASTITQQVAKNVFLDSDKNVARKLKEFLLAVKLEENFKKPKILEVYLNVIEFGEGLYGIGRAARFYFNKPASQLTAKEGAFLAMLLPSPKRYSQSFRAHRLTRYAQHTVNSILGKMAQAHYITEEEKIAERARPLSFEAAPAPGADGIVKGSTAESMGNDQDEGPDDEAVDADDDENSGEDS